MSESIRGAVLNSLTLRRNFNLLYEQLDSSLLIPVLNRNYSYEEHRGLVESYHGYKHAQNAAVIEAILAMHVQVNVPDICVALGANSDQKRIAQQLLRGMYKSMSDRICKIWHISNRALNQQLHHSKRRVSYSALPCTNAL